MELLTSNQFFKKSGRVLNMPLQRSFIVQWFRQLPLHKECSFPLRISSVNGTKSACRASFVIFFQYFLLVEDQWGKFSLLLTTYWWINYLVDYVLKQNESICKTWCAFEAKDCSITSLLKIVSVRIRKQSKHSITQHQIERSRNYDLENHSYLK